MDFGTEQQEEQEAKQEYNGPCFILIRFQMSLVQTCKNALTKWLSVHSNYTGSVSGVCGDVTTVEGRGCEKGIALIYFDKVDIAIRWHHSVPEIRQPDWLGGVDMVLVPVCHEPDPDSIHYIQLLDLDIYNYDHFRDCYSEQASQLIQKHGGKQIVSTKDTRKLKGLWEPNYLVINCWGCQQRFTSAYHGDENNVLREKRMVNSYADSYVFELQPLIPSK